MANEDDVAALIDLNEVNRSINRFTVDEVVARINQNEVSRSIKKFTRSNFQIWKFQMMIIFQSKELLDIVEGTKMIENVDDQRIWRKHDNHAITLIIIAIAEKSMASLLKCRASTAMWQRLFTVHEQSARENKHILQQHFFNLAMKPNQDMSGFISE
jgi:Lhr-like helicase